MHVFHIAESSRGPYWVMLPVIVILLVVGALVAVTLHGSRNSRFELSHEGSRLIPTQAGYSLLLSPDDPDAFLLALAGL